LFAGYHETLAHSLDRILRCLLQALGILGAMKKMPFYKIFILTLCACAIPTYAIVRYFDFDSIGIGNLVITAIVVSMLPALLISIWWWNYQDEE